MFVLLKFIDEQYQNNPTVRRKPEMNELKRSEEKPRSNFRRKTTDLRSLRKPKPKNPIRLKDQELPIDRT